MKYLKGDHYDEHIEAITSAHRISTYKVRNGGSVVIGTIMSYMSENALTANPEDEKTYVSAELFYYELNSEEQNTPLNQMEELIYNKIINDWNITANIVSTE